VEAENLYMFPQVANSKKVFKKPVYSHARGNELLESKYLFKEKVFLTIPKYVNTVSI